MSESLSTLLSIMLVFGGVLHAGQAAVRVELVATEIHDAWLVEHETRMCGEREALRRNLADVASSVRETAKSGRSIEDAQRVADELWNEADGLWPGKQGVKVDDDWCRGKDGSVSWIRREGRRPSVDAPASWPRWAVRWGMPSNRVRSD